ncbi:MAG TPA: enoyl-CoA hydratase/isomerase family protein, partial [Gammaproteobacteria bacterium]|nr:enoyl-CoA hydratase/isomerase family protein [Gammaproteobacteria bacterium]
MDYEDLLYEIREDIAVITLNRPERLNALTPAMREGILQAMLAADSDPEVRVIVLTGAGRGFCSGGDVKAMNEARSSGAVNILEDKISPVRDKAVMAMRNAKKT